MSEIGLKRKHKNLIITPHPLEASRLLNCSLEEVLNNLEGSAKKLTEKYKNVSINTWNSLIVDYAEKNNAKVLKLTS